MAFLNLNIRFESLAQYTNWLLAQPRPRWGVLGSTIHNTYRPNKAQWRGHDSMVAMARDTYIPKGWTTGPTAFVAIGTAFDGIYLMAGPQNQAIHAGPCNDNRFGWEWVGDGEVEAMSLAEIDFISSLIAITHRWAGVGPDMNMHRDCMAGRTCPGSKVYAQKATIQGAIRAKMTPAPIVTEIDPWDAWGALGKPEGAARNFAIPRAWFGNRWLGRCLFIEDYTKNNHRAIAEFEQGTIHYIPVTNQAVVYKKI